MATTLSPLADLQGLANAPGWLDAFRYPRHVELASPKGICPSPATRDIE
jgi:hypothetical protein